jgi:hypothetical protein
VAAPALITQEDLEERFPPQFVAQVFSDDGSLEPGDRLAVACAVATRIGQAVLLKGWPDASHHEALVADDEAVKSALCEIAMFEGMKGKPQWSGQGSPYFTLRKDALAVLELLVQGQLRSVAEKGTAGANPNRRGNITSPDCPQFVFAPSNRRPRPGGY